MQPSSQVLLLDQAGSPSAWVAPRVLSYYAAKNLIAWDFGEVVATLRGGTNARTGLPTLLDVKSIVAIKGLAFAVRQSRVPAFSRPLVMRRDRCLCAYCGEKFPEDVLTLEHIVPESRGGKTSWTNIVAACKPCNGRKDNRTPEEARMPLLFVPYAPNRFEKFILENRRILADQMDWLMKGVGADSRLKTN